jgi:hypothetical protein
LPHVIKKSNLIVDNCSSHRSLLQLVTRIPPGPNQVSRLVLLLFLYTAFHVWWVVEQPQNSLLETHPKFAMLCRLFRIFKVRVRMGEFGGETEKPTWLYSNMQIVEELGAHKTRTWDRSMTSTHHVNRYVDANGKKCCTGNSDLKSSQAFDGQQLSHWVFLFCVLVIPRVHSSMVHTILVFPLTH